MTPDELTSATTKETSVTDVIMDKDTFEADGDGEPMMLDDALDEQLIAQLADRARSEGLQLTGQGGLLAGLTKTVLETAVEARWTSTSATPSTTRPAATAATRATAPARRRC